MDQKTYAMFVTVTFLIVALVNQFHEAHLVSAVFYVAAMLVAMAGFADDAIVN